LALQEIKEIRALIDNNIVWSRSLDKPYQIWQQQAKLLEGVLSGNKEAAIEDTLDYFEQAMSLPKAHRDREFRTLLRLLRVTALTCQKI
jgi:hypothetical protein